MLNRIRKIIVKKFLRGGYFLNIVSHLEKIKFNFYKL